MRNLSRILLPTVVALLRPLAALPAGAQQYERDEQSNRDNRDNRDGRDGRDNRDDRMGRDSVRGAVEVVVRDLASKRDLAPSNPRRHPCRRPRGAGCGSS